MAIVSKTNPKGVDAVINAIQEYLFSNLSGAGWSNYECYPRANKNIKGSAIIPEVSTDVKNYIEVLFNDKFNATSFFLVDDNVNFNNEERLIVQSIDLVFQVNLPKLFPTVTGHRADEEMHAQILQLLTENEELFVDVDGYTTGVDNVYSGLRLRDYSKDNINLDDISEFHVVKFTFDVTWSADDCDVNFSPVCDPVTITGNSILMETANSGTAYSFLIKDTNDLSVGVWNPSTLTWVVPPAVGDPAGVELNSSGLVDIPSGDEKIMTIVDQFDDPVDITTVTNTAGVYKGSVEVAVPTVIGYNRARPQWQISFNDYDEGWRHINTWDSYVIPANAVMAEVDKDDYYKLVNVNAFGIIYRFGNDFGDYYNSDDDTYRLLDGTLSDRATVFQANDYGIDHYSGIGWFLLRGGAQTIPTALNTAFNSTAYIYSDWILPMRREFEQIFNNTLIQQIQISGNNKVFDIQLNLKSSTPYANSPTTQGWQIITVGQVLIRNYLTADAGSLNRIHYK